MILFLILSLHMLDAVSSQSQITGYSVITIITAVWEMFAVQSNFFFRDGSTSKVTPSWPLLFLLATMPESAGIVSILFFNYGCRC